jgi:hypothetical protein
MQASVSSTFQREPHVPKAESWTIHKDLPIGRSFLLQLLAAVKTVVIGATATRSTGGAKKKKRRSRTEKGNRSFLFNNFPVEINTCVANKRTSGSCNEPFYLVLLFTAERATIGESCFVHALIIGIIRHCLSPLQRVTILHAFLLVNV